MLPDFTDQCDNILVFDFSTSIFVRSELTTSDRELIVRMNGLRDSIAANVEKFQLQLLSLIRWWMSDRPQEDVQRTTIMRRELALSEHIRRRREACLAERAKLDTAEEAFNDNSPTIKLELLLAENAIRFHDTEGKAGLRRRDIYAYAGQRELSRGGQAAKNATMLVDEFMRSHFSVKSTMLTGGYDGYRGIEFI